MTTDPVVTVLIMTFDHERYINQALESVLTQETEFPYDVIVIDDCSTDGTAEALHRLAERFPGRFTVRRPPANRNDLHDFGVALDDCPSPYVAMLDGDDYWTSTTKLARQVALLELHPEYALSCHAVHPINADGTPSTTQYEHRRPRYERDDLWSACFIHAGSVVFRRSAFDRLPAWYFESTFGDWELFLLVTARGDVHFLDERLSAYRIHEGGMWSGLGSRRQADQIHDFYRHQQRAWGREFRTNRSAMLSRSVTLAFRYGEADARLLAWRWLLDAVLRATIHRPGGHGPTRQEIKRLLAWRVRADRDHLLRRHRQVDGKVDGEAAAGQTLGGSRHGAQHSFDVAPTPVDEPFLD
ncbi:MAG: glycosyltransferase [Ilumatobacteraceae bacterium]|jgi:glycosyltransferase involved in cell wall biosynthesis|nr:glycosyltransferase [Ilumatobacteraceae bacterium]